jgi:bifunctional N-acetylglucosamine-1-phosphate-uridyltransferase/glucosamine-1-phosphate-acetyltransferase GlmU-like protein
MKWKEIKTWERVGGWYIEPATETKYCYVGDDVQLGDDVRLGAGVRLGARVRLGNDVQLGASVRLGDDVSIPVYKSYRYAIHWHSPGTIRAGCLIKPFDWCTANVRQVAALHGYPPDEQERYAGFIRQIIEWEKIMGDKVGLVRLD